MKTTRYIIIVGCGRLGSNLANIFSKRGDSVVIIDKNDETFNKLSPDFSGFRINGDVTQMAVLNNAKLEQADVFIATTHDDNVNLMAAQVAKKIFKVSHVLARVFDPKREQVYTRLGVDTICPTTVATEIFVQSVLKNNNNTKDTNE
ncbi:TPA: potassium transporter TrkA [Candidatus Marinimicrobia bacterium]|nr:potassium transporter TrkA [Candidatus Neomarinimicrobiota bacterium]